MIHKAGYILSLLIILTVAGLFHFANAVALNPFEQFKQKQSSDDVVGLYSTKEDVEILTVANFKDEIYGNKRALFVEFYNSWCGHCQGFAPSWKALATDLSEWKDLLAVAAIDCSNEENNALCRNFEIMGYPTLKYFHENFQEAPDKLGVLVSLGSDEQSLKSSLLKMLVQEQREGRGKQFPNLLPYESGDLHTGGAYTFLVIQNADETIGTELSMDLHNIKEVSVKYVLTDNKAFLDKYKLDIGSPVLPALFVVEPSKPPRYLQTDTGSREAFKASIRTYLKSKNILVHNDPKVIFKGKWQNVKGPDMNEFMHKKEQEALAQKIKAMGDVVFQMDLETALRFSLKHEVASIKVISGPKLAALKAYLNVLVRYFPFGKYGQLFLIELRDFVANSKTVKGSDIFEMVKEAEREERQVFSSPPHWMACQGSTTSHRGHPCGLWKLFHYLTVNAADYSRGLKGTNPRVVLIAMHAYVKHFLGCSQCSEHFQEMAKRRGLSKVNTWQESVLWLWKAHNEVNKRLAGDLTEDPQHPKIQFPSEKNCPICRNIDGSWNEPEVVIYLQHVYSSINVRYIGSDTRILHLGLNGSMNEKVDFGMFRSLDASMCFILYLASFTLILVLIYIFLTKRRYRKKLYRHDLLGKV